MGLELLVIEDRNIKRFLAPEDCALVRRAEAIDRIDRIISPIESVLQAFGGPFLYGCGVAFEAVELVVLKAPFMVQYVRRTGDYGALGSWLPRELIGVFLPFGDLVDLTAAYHDRVQDYYEERLLKEGKRYDR